MKRPDAYYDITKGYRRRILLHLVFPFFLFCVYVGIGGNISEGDIPASESFEFAFWVIGLLVVIVSAFRLIPSGIHQAISASRTRKRLASKFPKLEFPDFSSTAVINGQTFAWTAEVLCLPYGALIPLKQIGYVRNETNVRRLLGFSIGKSHRLVVNLLDGTEVTALYGKVSETAFAPLDEALSAFCPDAIIQYEGSKEAMALYEKRRHFLPNRSKDAKARNPLSSTVKPSGPLADELDAFFVRAHQTIYKYFVDHIPEAGEGKFRSQVGVTFDIPTTHNCGLIVLTYNPGTPSKHMLIASALREDEDEKLDDFIMTGTEAEIMKYLEDMDAHRNEWVEVFVELSNKVDARH